MIGVDWGTSSFRAFRLDAAGAITARVAAPRGITTIAPGGFEAALRDQIAPWLAAGEDRVLMCGMVGSRQGWVEAPYVPCPASPASVAAGVVAVPFEGARVRLVPGVSDRDAGDVPEVMRGEETQLAGVMAALSGRALACLPGSHAKWATLDGGRIEAFSTYLSGEAFAAVRAGTILGRMMPDAPPDPAAFARGVARSGSPGHLLHHLFGVRALGLFGELAESASASYLSGLLIGHEVRAALQPDVTVHLIGAAGLCALYASAIAACGGRSVIEDEDAAARGLFSIAEDVAWT